MFTQDNGRRSHSAGNSETNHTGMAGSHMTQVCPNRPILASAVLIGLLFLVAFAAVHRDTLVPAQAPAAITETVPAATAPALP
jgi:hypothetical protein